MRSIFAISVLLLLGGCKKGYDQQAMAKLTAPEQKIVGKYKMESEFNASGGEGSAQMKDFMEILSMLEGGETLLECFPDKTFEMLVGELPVKGQWSLAETNLRLRITKVGEKKPEEITRKDLKVNGLSGWAMSPDQREEFLSTYRGSIALERAESMSLMRVSSDGTLYASAPQNSLFGSMVTYFKKIPEK